MFKARINKVKGRISDKLDFNKNANYGNWWQTQDRDFYERIFNTTPEIHEHFQKWVKEKSDIKTVMEIGCGDGRYARTIFKDQIYHGVDINKNIISKNIETDKDKNNSYNATDFISDPLYENKKFDLVCNMNVIDHVYDIEKFVKKCINSAEKYVWISAYMGYFPELKAHKMEWSSKTKCYHNMLSITQLEQFLNSINIKYEIEPFNYTYIDKNTDLAKIATNIIITK